jgi:hypothetical protein
MMHDDMMWGMMLGRLTLFLIAVLIIAALIKYLFFLQRVENTEQS